MALQPSDPASPFGRLDDAPGGGGAGEASGSRAHRLAAHPTESTAPGAPAAASASAGVAAEEARAAAAVRTPAGIRIDRAVSVVVMALAGLLAGTLTTMLHRARLDLGFGPIWLGIAASLACLALLAAGLRLYLRERGPVLGFAVGVTVAILGLASWSAGRSVIVVPDLVGFCWMVGAPAAVWLAACWPSTARARTGAASPSPALAEGTADREYPGGSATDPEEPQP